MITLLEKNSFSANSKIRRKPGLSRYSILTSVKYLRATSSLSVIISASEIWFFMAESQNSGIPDTLSADSSGFSVSASSFSSSSSPALISSSVGSAAPLTIFARFSYSGVNLAKYFFSSCKTSSWNSASNFECSFCTPFKPATRRRTGVGRDSIYPDERPTREPSLPCIIWTSFGFCAKIDAAAARSNSSAKALAKTQ